VPVNKLVHVAVSVPVAKLVHVAVSVPKPVNEFVPVLVVEFVPVIVLVAVAVRVPVAFAPPVLLTALEPPVPEPVPDPAPPVDVSAPGVWLSEPPHPVSPTKPRPEIASTVEKLCRSV